MKACLYLSNDKFVEIDNLEKVIKSGHRGTVEISKEKIKSSLFTNGSYTFVGDKIVATASAKIEFIEFID
ncbi:TPA: hypothetical protein ACRVCS_000700 [Staphylococcus aureus]|uniref:hypothetical protein n=1 Tax=Staphylococcus aureus TaxID=1280 RepID=UPI000E3C06D9|nr:hypothetical protein [Staphylococcus aureus]GBS47284.1 hypothetical protein M1KS0501p2_1182 [Staphylococcus aureus]GBS51191.1 hypothetical protein M1KS0501p3_2539 [Staphylococcus aureus]GBT60204.1 hypothetical protein M6KS0501p1_2540 [Staphylococcus aureus]GBT61318.1 hypothetical protein M6KS0501p2_1013 [Staphylococcus aureus]HDC8797557.1 hypothetical protein [Staphylococcus aureus]